MPHSISSPQTKSCLRCNRVQALDCFEVGRNPNRRRNVCKDCRNTQARLRAASVVFIETEQCHYCGVQITLRNRSIDHVIPKCLGGADDPSNLVTACRSCNFSKQRFTLEEWRGIRQRQENDIPWFSTAQLEFFEKHGVEIPLGKPFKFWFETGEVKPYEPRKRVR